MSQEAEPDPSTMALLRRAEQADDQAVSQLLSRHRLRLLKMVDAHLDHRLAGRIDPADVVQEAVMEASRRLPEYLRDPHVPFYPWLRRIAHDRLVDLQRHHLAQKRSVLREQHWVPSDFAVQSLSHCLAAPGSSPSQHVRKEEARACVRSMLKRLSTTDRDVLVLRYVEQLSASEAAHALGIREDAFTKRHMRALKHFRLLLEDSSGVEEIM